MTTSDRKGSSNSRYDEGDKNTNETLLQFIESRHDDRDRGFLTPQDRELLYSPQTDLTRTQRYRMRKRSLNGIKDFELLSYCMDELDREKVYRDLFEEEDGFNYVVHLGALLYEAVKDSEYDAEDFIEKSIEIAEDQEGFDAYVDITAPEDKRPSVRPRDS